MRILLIEDDELLGDGVRTGIAQAGFAVDWARDGREAESALELADYDAVVLDLGLPGPPEMGGLELLSRWRAGGSALPVLILTARDTVADRISGLDRGADDYLVKPFDLMELQVRVRAVLRRASPQVDQRELAVGDLTLDLLSRTAHVGDRSALLTPTECSLLEYLMRRPNEVLSTARLLEEIWKYPPGVGDPALVRMHVRHLREKLETNPSQPRWIQTIGRQGYTIRDPAQT